MVIPFGLKNALAIFSRIVVATFKDFIHKFIEVYFNDWTVFGLVKDHIESLRMMLERSRQYQISLNLKKFIICTPFGDLLDHVVCPNGILVDPAKIAIIIDLPLPTKVKQLRATLGHTRYLRKFIKGYAKVIALMEKLLKKDTKFQWTTDCQESLDKLKNKMATTPILVFLDWEKEFHFHVDTSFVVLDVVLMYPGEGSIDHPIAFASRKLLTIEKNYTMTEREGLEMVYAL